MFAVLKIVLSKFLEYDIGEDLGKHITHQTLTCSKLTIKTLKKGLKYVES